MSGHAVDDAGRTRWLLAGATLVLVGTGLGLRDPWPSDEPRFVLITQQMLAGGDWLIPWRGGEPYADKPPLFFWVQAAAIAAFGPRLGFLLPAIVSALAIVLLTHDLVRRLYGPRPALWAGLALLALPQFVLVGRSGQIDALLCLWTSLGLYGTLRYLLLDRHPGWLTAGFGAMGLGVITKGVGFLPLLLLPVYAWARHRGWRHLAPAPGHTRWHWLVACAALLLPILAWVAAVQWRVAAEPALAGYRDELLLHQTAGRYFGAAYHPRPWWYLIVQVIPLFWLPLVLLLPYLVPRWREAWRGRDARVLLPLGWVLLVIAFFSLSGGKRGIYVAPAMPALVLAAAPWLAAALADPRIRRLVFVATTILAAGVLACGVYLVAAPPPPLRPLIDEYAYNPFLIALLVGAVALPAALALGPRRAGHGLLALFATAWLAYGGLAYPLFDDARSGRRLMRLAESGLGPGQTLGLVGWKEQMMLQAEVPVREFGFSRPLAAQAGEALEWLAAEPHRRALLLPRAVSAACVNWQRGRELPFAHGRHWVVIDATAIDGDCAAGGP